MGGGVVKALPVFLQPPWHSIAIIGEGIPRKSGLLGPKRWIERLRSVAAASATI